MYFMHLVDFKSLIHYLSCLKETWATKDQKLVRFNSD